MSTRQVDLGSPEAAVSIRAINALSARKKAKIQFTNRSRTVARRLLLAPDSTSWIDSAGGEARSPAGYPFLLHYKAAGFADCWVSAHTLEKRLTLHPTRLAALAIENETGQELTVEGPAADRLDALHPGPLSLILRLADGRRTLVSLELAPGERRALSIRD